MLASREQPFGKNVGRGITFASRLSPAAAAAAARFSSYFCFLYSIIFLFNYSVCPAVSHACTFILFSNASVSEDTLFNVKQTRGISRLFFDASFGIRTVFELFARSYNTTKLFLKNILVSLYDNVTISAYRSISGRDSHQ